LHRDVPPERLYVDLSQIDFDALKAQFDKGYKHTEAEKLKGAIASQLTQMVRLNKSRMNYLDKFQQMIDEYNAGSRNVETFFTELVEFADRSPRFQETKRRSLVFMLAFGR
jgi:type I restriction enzyme R subunit